jgi:hypothetical protein
MGQLQLARNLTHANETVDRLNRRDRVCICVYVRVFVFLCA